MYNSPNHPNPPRAAGPPAETGKRVATFERYGGEELRVTLAEYQGRPYVSLRVWSPGQDGALWPRAGKGLSIKTRELAGLAQALAAAARQIGAAGQDAHPPAQRQAEPPPRRGSIQPPFEPGSVPAGSSRPGFDEFDGG